ncbi:ATP-grasp domain-containing protein [Mangrovimonas sp. TPBH4]|uniref:ATP-grasp domain-containing protein n=1 Tax=Mangrovimonas sp. TPBH4 TaxID=1645914 RepID=UPI0006B420C3|nr:ATP-grasp domain-containing protein [Mangrovimonas sp. TPBH4]
MKISVLIPDGESHMLIYVVNCLAQHNEVKIHIMSDRKWLPMRFSNYIYHYSFYPKLEYGEEWINNINRELQEHNIDVVMPIFEHGIRTMITYRDRLIDAKVLGLLPKLRDFNTAINKNLLSKLLTIHNMPLPKSLYVNGKGYPKELKYPVIIKPVEGFGGGQGVNLLVNETELKLYLEKSLFGKEFLIQEVVQGYDIGCSVLCKEGKILSYTIQKEIQKAVNVLGPLTGMEFIKEEKVLKIVELLMEKLNWSGVGHVDLRYDKVKGDYKIIEVNTRFWSSLEGSEIAGVNFPYLYCLASMGMNFDMPNYSSVSFYNLKGLLKLIKDDIKVLINTSFVLNNTPLKYALGDPIPMGVKFIARTKNIFVNKLKEVTHNLKSY